jgi:CTP:molybdopterin cytidylyltransferase MocA
VSVVVAGCVLAAGAGQRLGSAKASVAIDGRTFLDRLLESLATAGVAPRLVVGRADEAATLRTACDRRDARLLLNPAPERGMLSSVHVCLHALTASAAAIDALVVAPVDCPLVRSETVAALVTAFAVTRASIVVPRHGDRRGHPTLFAASLFAELLQAPLDVGARPGVRAHAADRLELPVDDPAVLDDIDTPAALAALRERDARRDRPAAP